MNLSMNGNAQAGDNIERDEQLLWTKDILTKLHERYYAQDLEGASLKTVPEILNDMRREVLLGKKIVLSGLVPLHRQNEQNILTKPRPGFIRYTESMGAKVSCCVGLDAKRQRYVTDFFISDRQILPTVQPNTSYVVAKTDGTDKVLAGRKTPGCHVVERSWLMQCYWSLTHRDPKPHLLRAQGRERGAPTSPPNIGATSRGGGRPENQAVAYDPTRPAYDPDSPAPAYSPTVPADEDATNRDAGPENQVVAQGTDEDSDEEDDELAAEFEEDFM